MNATMVRRMLQLALLGGAIGSVWWGWRTLEADRAYGIGKAYLDRRDIPKAMGRLEEAVRLDPGKGLAHFSLAGAFIQQFSREFMGKVEHSRFRNRLTALLADKPGSRSNPIPLAALPPLPDEIALAVPDQEIAARRVGLHPVVFQSALMAEWRGDLPSAIAGYELALCVHASDNEERIYSQRLVECHLAQAVEAVAAGDFASAILSTQAALIAKPESSIALAVNGLVLLQAGGADEAAGSLRASLKRNPDEILAAIGLARIEQAGGQPKQAAAFYEYAMNTTGAGQEEARQVILNDCLAAFRARQVPEMGAVAARLMITAGRMPEARKILLDVLRSLGDQPDPHFQLAATAHAMQDYELARQELVETLALSPNHFMALRLLARMNQ